jgi:hypothetical protein
MAVVKTELVVISSVFTITALGRLSGACDECHGIIVRYLTV